jgi:GT2 family glycosyltransferase
MARLFGMVTTRDSGEYTVVALESFFRHTPIGAGDAVLLIDNDGAWNESSRGWPVEVLVNREPRSFAENANEVIRRANRAGAYAYFMNNDIVFTAGWSEPLAVDVAAVMTPTCNQNFGYRRGKLELKPVMTLAEFEAGAGELEAVVAEHRQMHPEVIEAYKTNFFCVKIPPTVYRKVGLFDTRFGVAGGEDDDYCIRTYLHGLSVRVAQASYLVHFGGRATWSGPETREQWEARERHFIEVFREKWGPTLARFLLWRDASVVSRDPSLRAAEQRGGTRELMAELARRDGVNIQQVLASCPRLGNQ